MTDFSTSADTLVVPCPAKINLFLHILGRLPNGYHQLQTVFQLLDYGDTLTVRQRQDSQLTLSPDLADVDNKDNLVLRAAIALRRFAGYQGGADLYLEKRLPIGGGIGGGSSDAASTLLALNQLWQLNLSLDTLASIGQQLGADVPVFVHGATAWAEGTGEKLTPLSIPSKWYLVLRPNCFVSTGEIFSHQQLTRQDAPIKIAAFLEGGTGNSCQPLVRKLYPEVDKALIWLDKFSPAMLTGTGSCVFASFDNEDAARAVLAQRPEGTEGFVARGVDLSPAHTALGIA
ncbi:4-(cytidine 5'-diphospho)-2-C-methyl-D-erythritol kinase [Spongiibacter nanhainus]|uniref:4-diphosphocytidyl-2-C-methyl-D-erythritol kinase n=1 Tax=Spongiibacter nanhainus TaxID=2794344 RepID=A0A7T4QZI6_9GAMM|nr:4-(cytidine 5'-diphospho)-2-C-methyl-D-erythritol kinase [Spongiibacter nanhainus]QQD17651.1 4-(cytidine 5'-diphospho)-2-C-methyl-D-erythritol kinase [Spongiibacter nanhainus]